MNSEKSQDTERFKVLIVGSPSRGTLKMLDHLTETYGDRLEVIRDEGKGGGEDISFIVMDEFSELPDLPTKCPEIEVKGVHPNVRSYWQKGRWE